MLNTQVDLTNCDREPIHIPGSIQPHGALLASDAAMGHVCRFSANLASMLGVEGIAEGVSLEACLGGDVVHTLRNALASSNASRRPSLLFGLQIGSGRFDIAVHKSGSEAIIEFEPVTVVGGQPLDLVRMVIARIRRSVTVEKLVDDTARLIRATLGYDRVMIYRFEDDGAGQVISEAKSAQLESFLGQYFPASDIPQQARALYVKNTIRIISDAACIRVPVMPELDVAGQPLDLSQAHLRSVSPIHCEYLRNMGVAASMSISIVIDGQLWGLIACHHYAPKHLSMSERVAIEMFGEFFSLHLDVMRQKAKIDTAISARRAIDRFLQDAPRHNNILELLRQSLDRFGDMLPCDGVGLWMGEVWTSHRSVPPESAIPELARFVGTVSEGRIWSSRMLSLDFPAAAAFTEAASGIIAIPLSQRPRDFLFLFRKEFEHTLNWAGNPNKSYESGPLGDRLTPRKSFAIWKEEVKAQSRRWTDTDIETAEAIRLALVEIVLRHNEIIAEERGRADLRQRMLNEELNHRVKNILAVIKSLVGQPNPEDRTLDEYLTILRGRIEALATAHDQIVRGEGGGLLGDLLKAEIAPYRDQTSDIVLDGPSVWVDTTAFSVLALVIHELATNSAKYGALSSATGRLQISWRLSARGDCELDWQESGGPTVNPPKRKGFGSILISRSIPHDLGGEARLDYRPSGLVGNFVIPASRIAQATNDKWTEQPEADLDTLHPRRSADLESTSVLLVEDQMLIAMDAEMMLSEIGLTNVVTVSSASEALRRLQDFTPAAAVLDVNLGGGTSVPVAEELRRQQIPFIFATGYGEGGTLPEDFSAVKIVRKPYSNRDLISAVLDMLKH